MRCDFDTILGAYSPLYGAHAPEKRIAKVRRNKTLALPKRLSADGGR